MFTWQFIYLYIHIRGRDSVVGIATRYGLDGPGIESRWGRDFPHPSRTALGPTQPPLRWVPGVKRPGRGADHPPPSMCRGHERVELYLYSPSGPSWSVIGRTFIHTHHTACNKSQISYQSESFSVLLTPSNSKYFATSQIILIICGPFITRSEFFKYMFKIF
jgi:hypothetical protein